MAQWNNEALKIYEKDESLWSVLICMPWQRLVSRRKVLLPTKIVHPLFNHFIYESNGRSVFSRPEALAPRMFWTLIRGTVQREPSAERQDLSTLLLPFERVYYLQEICQWERNKMINPRVYFDIKIAGEKNAGRIVFELRKVSGRSKIF